ncbi:HD domain-containing protein [Chlorobium limicola]|uniref:Phosphohydrolase n=1 Tax=Chlorobium limicola TaxID=1092 RepID=A0A101J543_CHLLI|nr:HD domain-containing protein [Chlorobium limicola]KUL20420.1 phosphohydrolase [Chlorobium limicola]
MDSSAGGYRITCHTSPIIEELLASYRGVLGADYDGYGNHCLRVFNFCFALSGSRPEQEEKIAVASVFHDLGIWTASTFDYLVPSQELARNYLDSLGKTEWQEEIAAMIGEHHKLTPVTCNPLWLAEPFRRADLIDISIGLIKFRLPDDFVAEVLDAYPNAGFHKKLIALSFERFKSHPFNPLPMVKL